MEILGGLLVAMILLSLLGSVTVLALASMAVLGLTTEMSFRRLFFVSFGIGLLAPILLGMGVASTVSDESFRHELLTELDDLLSGSQTVSDALPRFRELQQQFEDGTITRDQFEDQMEQLVEESTGAQVEIDGVEVAPEGGPEADRALEGE